MKREAVMAAGGEACFLAHFLSSEMKRREASIGKWPYKYSPRRQRKLVTKASMYNLKARPVSGENFDLYY